MGETRNARRATPGALVPFHGSCGNPEHTPERSVRQCHGDADG